MAQPPDDPPEPFRPPPPIYAPPPTGEGAPPPPYAPPPPPGPPPAGAAPGAYPLPGAAEPYPPSARPTRRTPLIIGAVAAAFVLVLLVAGAAVYLATRGDGGYDGGPADLRQPMVLQQVAAVSQAPCAAGTLPEASGTSCYRLAGGGMTVRRVEHMKAEPPSGGATFWTIQIGFTRADGQAFARLTGIAAQQQPNEPGQRIAMVVGGQVLSAPAVTGGPITGGTLQISNDFTRAKAEDLVARIIGRRPS